MCASERLRLRLRRSACVRALGMTQPTFGARARAHPRKQDRDLAPTLMRWREEHSGDPARVAKRTRERREGDREDEMHAGRQRSRQMTYAGSVTAEAVTVQPQSEDALAAPYACNAAVAGNAAPASDACRVRTRTPSQRLIDTCRFDLKCGAGIRRRDTGGRHSAGQKGAAGALSGARAEAAASGVEAAASDAEAVASGHRREHVRGAGERASSKASSKQARGQLSVRYPEADQDVFAFACTEDRAVFASMWMAGTGGQLLRTDDMGPQHQARLNDGAAVDGAVDLSNVGRQGGVRRTWPCFLHHAHLRGRVRKQGPLPGNTLKERERETGRQRQTETDRDRQRQTETDRERERSLSGN